VISLCFKQKPQGVSGIGISTTQLTSARKVVVRRFNIVSAHVRRLRARSSDAGVTAGFVRDLVAMSLLDVAALRARGGLLARFDLVQATVWHEVGEAGVVVDLQTEEQKG